MEIIKEAFVEGRETTVSFEKSKAKQNQVKMDVALENLTLIKQHKIHEPHILQQVDPNTGKVLNTFPTRLAAARYIVANILKNPAKNPISVTGNMDMCIRAGWKAYGYYWRKVTGKTINDGHQKAVDNIKIWVNHRGLVNVYDSYAAVAETFGLSIPMVKDLYNGTTKYDGITVRKYNEKLMKMEFDTLAAAMKHAGVREEHLKKLISNKKPRNNVIYSVKDYTPSTKYTLKYAVYQGNKIIGKFHTINEVERVVGQSRSIIDKRRKANRKLGEYSQYTLKTL